MRIAIELDLNDAIFHDSETGKPESGHETARILRKLAELAENSPNGLVDTLNENPKMKIYSLDGNSIGRLRFD